MNAIQHTKIVLLLLIATALLGCQQDDQFDIPAEIGTEENKQLNALLADIEKGNKTMISIAQLKDYFVYRRVHTFSSDVVVKGYVVSSDSTGNFYKELYLQDAPENPTAAFHLMIDQSKSFNRFNLGREVYISLKNLHLGESRRGNGIISLGGVANTENNVVEALRPLDIATHLFRSKTTAEITPLTVKFSAIDKSHVGMFIAVENVRVTPSEQGKPFVDPKDYYDTQRTLEACEGTAITTFLLETSAFALYKDVPLPTGTGTIQGIVSKTYNGRNFVLTLNNAADATLLGAWCGN